MIPGFSLRPTLTKRALQFALLHSCTVCTFMHDTWVTLKVYFKVFVKHDAVYMNEPTFEGLNNVGFFQTTVFTIVVLHILYIKISN
jgi:hypothetical protein